MLKWLLFVGFLLGFPGAAHAQMQLRLLQQQQVWHLQQQERHGRAQHDEQVQRGLLRQPANLPPLPDPLLRDLGLLLVHPQQQKALQQRLIHQQQLLDKLQPQSVEPGD